MEIWVWILVGIPVLALLLFGGNKLSDYSGGGRSDYNIHEDRGVVLDSLPSKKSRKRRWRRKRFAQIEKAQKDAANDPSEDLPGSDPSSNR